jgi:DNA-binding NarL/FixJ family response regulator
MMKQEISEKEDLKILIVDDSAEAIEQFSSWIMERWPKAELYKAQTPEAAIKKAADHGIENLVLDLDLGAREDSGVVVARKILEERQKDKKLLTRVLFRTVHAGDPGYLRQIEKLINDQTYRPQVWGFLDKGAVPKRLALNAVEQVFVYELSFVDIFNQRLKESPSRELSNLEFTVLIYLCLGVTNDGIGWLIGTSRQSVERIMAGLYRKLGIPARRDALKGVPALLESRTRLCSKAVTNGFVNPNLLREEDAELREQVKKNAPSLDRLYINPDWLEGEKLENPQNEA